MPSQDEPRWQFTLDPPENDSVGPLDADWVLNPLLLPAEPEISPWALDLDSRLIARVDSLDLATYRAFLDNDGIKRGWGKSINSLLRQTERERRGKLRIGLALPMSVAKVFGEGGAGLTVSGYRKILFTGRSQWSDQENSASLRQSKFPSLTMEQISRFTVEGTIGSKVSVKVDQDSKRTSDLENRIIIRYKGDEDDILQSLDLGNTTLTLSHSRFIGYSERIQGLFGIGATGKMGPVDFKMIASQEKGNTTRNRITAGANEQSVFIRDYAFDRYRFFDIGWVGNTNILQPGDSIVSFTLFLSTGSADIQNPLVAAYADVLDQDNSTVISQRFRELDFVSGEYWLDQTRHYLYFPRRIQNIETQALAYEMAYKRDGQVFFVGSLNAGAIDSPHKLQLLKTHRPSPNDPLWWAEWKNVYDLRVRHINYDDLDLKIYKGQLGDEENAANLDHQGGIRYLRLLGLDKEDGAGNIGKDGRVDLNDAILDTSNGLLIFPRPFPFADSSLLFPNQGPFAQDELSPLAEPVPTLYTSGNDKDKQEASKYYIKMITRQRSRTIRLGTVNIMDNSEVITFNNRRLRRGTDYQIDYGLGEVTFLNDDVLDPNANVTIDYEYAPFITVEKRSLFGFSADYDGGPNLQTGGTLLYKGTKATDRPAQLGQEPFRDIVGEVFLNWRTESHFLTKLVDAIPLIETEQPSRLDFQTALARSMPNPNTKGDVFIDDFEGARPAYSLGVLRETWTLGSPPLLSPGGVDTKRHIRGLGLFEGFRGLNDPGFSWSNRDPRQSDGFRVTDVYNRDVTRVRSNDQGIHVLILEMRPHDSPTVDKDAGEGLQDAWGGVMRALPVSSWDQSRAEFIEFRMAVEGGNAPGILHLDLGQISEDINANGELDTEDGGIRNRVLDDGEDVGLDGLPDSMEQRWWDGAGYHPDTLPDPAGDNWEREFTHPKHNGTDQNFADAVRGRIPDSEDIGGPSELDAINSYYQFSIRLDGTDPKRADSSNYTDARHNLVWWTYRIPLWDKRHYQTFHEGTEPDSSTAIQFARLWIDSTEGTTRVYIATVDLVQRTWDAKFYPRGVIDDTGVPGLGRRFPGLDPRTVRDPNAPDLNRRTAEPSFNIGVVNTEENTDYIDNKPPGVRGYRPPGSSAREKEQSLLLKFENFLPGDVGLASIKSPKQDYTGYRSLRMWVHAGESEDRRSLIFLRFGQDSLNYYEYRDTLVYDPESATNWRANEIVIDFNALTALKDTATVLGQRADVYDPVSKLGVFGRPSLSNVTYREIGIVRVGGVSDPAHTGRVWCDELRLTDVRKDPGLAAFGKVTLQLADLLGFTALVDDKDYAFRGLTQGRTNSLAGGASRNRKSFNGNIRFDKFLPQALRISLPISVNYTKTIATPRLLTGSDIILTEGRQAEETSTTISRGLSTRFSMRPQTKNWLVNSTIAAFSVRFGASRSESVKPTVPWTFSEDYTARAEYKLRLNKDLSIPALFWTRYLLMPQRVWKTRLSLLPTDFNAQGTVTRRKSTTINSAADTTNSYKRSFQGTYSLRMQPLRAMQVSYNMSTNRDLSEPEDLVLSTSPREFKLGKETAFTQRLTSNYRPQLFSFFSPTVTFSTNFRDNVDRRFADHDISVDRNWSVGGSFDLSRFWGALAGPARGGGGVRSRRRPPPKVDKDKLPTDSAAAPAPAKGRGSGLGPGSAWRSMIGGLRWITKPIGALNVTYQKANGASQRDRRDRPSTLYQFGLADLDTTFPAAEGVTNASFGQQNTLTERENLSIKNQLNFFGLLRFSSTYTNTISTSEKSGSWSQTKKTMFPALTTSLSRLERLKPIGWIFATASARFGYTRKIDQSFLGDPENPETNNVTEGTNFAPLISITGTTRKAIRITFQIDQTAARTTRRGIESERTTRQTRITADYSFTSPNGIPLPFLRSIRLKSHMSISVTVARKADESLQQLVAGGPLEKTQSNSDFSVSTRMNYSFSTRVRGGMSAEWVDRSTRGQSGNRVSHVRSLGIWAEFSF